MTVHFQSEWVFTFLRNLHVAHCFALEGESLRKTQAAQRLQEDRQQEDAA